jgi:hypothetical protein
MQSMDFQNIVVILLPASFMAARLIVEQSIPAAKRKTASSCLFAA